MNSAHTIVLVTRDYEAWGRVPFLSFPETFRTVRSLLDLTRRLLEAAQTPLWIAGTCLGAAGTLLGIFGTAPTMVGTQAALPRRSIFTRFLLFSLRDKDCLFTLAALPTERCNDGTFQ